MRNSAIAIQEEEAMSLQIQSALADKAIKFPASELVQMLEDMRLALEVEPESAPNIALEFVRRIASGVGKPTDARGGLAPWQKRRVDRHLRENLEHSIRMSELAREVKLSVSHFCRAFKKSFGETPHAYLLRLRLDLARELMLTTGEPLSQIALSCGLADQAHLSKLFRRAYHDTPNAWRRRNISDTQADAASRLTKSGIRQAA